MKIIEVKFAPWDKGYWFNPENHDLKVDDCVVVKTEIGTEIGKVIKIKDISEDKLEREVKPIFRKANLNDIKKTEQKNAHADQDLEYCKKLATKHELNAKFIGVHYSFDGGRITFAFTANGRIDFRELVKDLTKHFQKSIRLHQIGVRDEAKNFGEIGPCGKKLCCKTFLEKLEQINSDFAEEQNILHRGSDRLSGLCSRLKCCLRYEQNLYEDLNKDLPEAGQIIKTKQGSAKVLSRNTLKCSVNAQLLDNNEIIEIKIK